jgi:type IV pilus assembly protein PilQ
MLKNVMMTLAMVCTSVCLALAQTTTTKQAQPAQDAHKQAPIVMVEKAAPVPAGANPAVPGAAQGVPATEGEAESSEVLQMDMSQAGAVTVDFRDADIRNVLKMLSYKSGVNIIAGPEVEGVVNMQLKDVPWQKALDVILSTYGYGYEQKGTVIMVTTIDNLKKRREDAKVLAEQELITTETFLLNYGKAEDVLKAIDKMKTARGSINFDKRANAIIVNDVQSNVAHLGEVIQRLDSVTPQVLIEAKIIETTLGKNDNLGIDWGLMAQAGGAMRSTTFPVPASFHNLYLPSTAATVPSGGATLTYGTLDFRGVTAVLNLLKTRSNTNALSNPRIVTLDNQPAKISVGQQYPVPQYTYNEQQAKLQVSGWSYLDIGIIFNVTPHVNNAHVVTLDIEPTVTSIDRQVQVESTSMPLLNSESAKTSVMIKDGETLVIAGLIKDTVTKTVKRVPILGYIPILGLPFQNTVDSHTKTELLIFITPRIITPELKPASSAK